MPSRRVFDAVALPGTDDGFRAGEVFLIDAEYVKQMVAAVVKDQD